MKVKLYETLSMEIPEQFRPVSAEERQQVFGAVAPDHGFAAEDGALIGIVQTATPLAEDQVEQQIASYRQYYSRMVPGYAKGELRKSVCGGRTVAIMSYKSNAPTRDLYNLLALTTLEGRELLAVFSCDMQQALRYMRVFLRTVESMEFSEEE